MSLAAATLLSTTLWCVALGEQDMAGAGESGPPRSVEDRSVPVAAMAGKSTGAEPTISLLQLGSGYLINRDAPPNPAQICRFKGRDAESKPDGGKLGTTFGLTGLQPFLLEHLALKMMRRVCY